MKAERGRGRERECRQRGGGGERGNVGREGEGERRGCRPWRKGECSGVQGCSGGQGGEEER